jgi:hypothetical protein
MKIAPVATWGELEKGSKPGYNRDMQSIQHLWGDSKSRILAGFDRQIGDWGLPALVVLVGLGSFGLGRLSAIEEHRPVVSIGEAPAAGIQRAMPLGGQFVGSRTGTVYYFPWCGGAQQIPPDAQVWFTSEKAAQRAGYRAAKNCKGLSESPEQVQ